jgi:hypothetical protein
MRWGAEGWQAVGILRLDRPCGRQARSLLHRGAAHDEELVPSTQVAHGHRRRSGEAGRIEQAESVAAHALHETIRFELA